MGPNRFPGLHRKALFMRPPQFGMPSVALFFKKYLKTDIQRYAFHSNPWAESFEGFTEVSCQECRDRDLPLVIGQWQKAGMTDVIMAMVRHETESHPPAESTKTAA